MSVKLFVCHLTAIVIGFRILKNVLAHGKNAKVLHTNFKSHQNEDLCISNRTQP